MNLRKRFFLVFMLIFTLVAIAACGNADSIVTIKFDQDEYLGKVGSEVQTSVNIDAGSKYDANVIKNQLSYSSADETVVKVTDNKLVAVGQGTTTIKVEWSEKAIVFDTANVVIYTSSAPSIEFTEYSQNMLKGASQVIGYQFDTIYTDATVRWESANPEVATVDQNGKVTAVSLGEATIIAYSVVGESENSAVLKITVMESDFAINYVLNGGTNNAENLPGFSLLHLPMALKDPSRTGYDFEGWYLDSEFTEQVTSIAEGTDHDVTVYAKWAATSYDITYELDGGVNDEANPASYTINDVVELKPATKEGFKFLGWFTDAEFTTPFVKLENATGDVTVYAKYEVDSYKINYNLNGGSFVLPYIYQNQEEMVRDFVKDFNAHSGKTVTVTVKDGVISTDFFARSWMGDGSSAGYNFLTSEEYGAKWAWMLEILNAVRVANGKAELSATDGQAEARGEVHNFLGTFDGAGGTAGYGCDYSNLPFDVYAPLYLPKVDGVLEAPATYSPATGALVPDPVKADHTFVGWSKGAAAASIHTSANSNFWGLYATDIFLFKGANAQNPTFSFRIGLLLNPDGTYRVDRFAQSGAAFTASGLDAEVVISESYGGWAGTADFRAAIQVGQTVIIDGDLKTGVADVKFYNLDAREATAEVTSTANSGFWTTYKNDVFLFAKGSFTNATYSARVGIAKSDSGEYSVAAVAKSGDSLSTEGLEFLLVISGDYVNFAAVSEELAKVKVGQIVTFDGDPKSGKCKVSFTDRVTLVNGDADLNLEALFVQVKDENDLLYNLDGGKLSEGAPVIYLTSTGLVLTATAEKAGYTFKGWSLSKGGEIITEIPAGKRGELTLFANFEAIEYAIAYELNGGVFSVDSIEYIYANFDELVADFLKDYATKFNLEGLTANNFFTKSNSFGLVSFFKDEALAEKWEWLVDFMLAFNPSYNGLTYMKNPSSAANYNKYWRANLSAFMLQSKNTSPLSMDFTGIDSENFWSTYVPTKVVTVAANPVYVYTADQLPLELAEPTKEGAEFLGWCDNVYLKREFKSLPVGTLGDVKLYAKWSDSVEGKEMKAITYELNGGALPEGAAVEYETGVGLAALPQPTKAGYSFAGWTLTEEGTEYVTAISTSEIEDVKLYAHWTLETYTISYELNGAEFKIITPSVGAKLTKGNVSVNVTKLAGYYANYKTAIMLFTNSNVPYLYADKIAFDLVDGQYQVVEVALAEHSLTKAYPYVIAMHGEYEHYNDENVQAFLGVQVGQKLVIEGDLANANFTAFFAEEPDPITSVTTTSLGNYWGKYNTDLIVEVNSKAAYTWGVRIGLKKIGNGYVVQEVMKAGAASSGAVYDVVFITNADFPGYSDENVQAFLNAEVGAYVALDGDLTTGNVTFTLYSLENTADTTTVVDQEYPTSYNVEQLPLALVAPGTIPAGKKFVGWYLDSTFEGDKLEELPLGTVGNVTLYARIEDENWVEPVYHKLTFVLNGGELENAPTKYEEGKELVLPTPARDGYKFLGWTLSETGNNYVTMILTTDEEDLTLYAQWKEVTEGPQTLLVGEGQEYATLALALAAANDGDTIKLVAGNFEGATINKSVKLEGPNAGVNPNKENRSAEALISTDLVLAADNILVDGIAITGDARIVSTTAKEISNIKVTNLLVTGSTINVNEEANFTAPLYLVAGDGLYVHNFEISNSLFTDYNCGRPMIAFINGVDGLKIENNVFNGIAKNYNDGIKTDNTRACVKGEVSISHNEFHNFQQYTVWFRGFGGGNYTLVGNTFDNIGITAGSHAAFNFVGFKGTAEDAITLDVSYNKVTKGYMLLRVDANDAILASDTATVKYNALIDCAGQYYIKNASQMTITCDQNYWGTATPEEAKFMGVKEHTNDLTSLDDLPAEPVYHTLTFVLNDGSLENAPEKYEEGKELVLPTPSRDGYTFLGWTASEEGTVYVTKVEATDTTDLVFYAQWKEIPAGPKVLMVGEGQEFATFALAMEAASNGDTIRLVAGSYEGAVVSKTVTIEGPNAGVNPNTETRGDEALFTTSITVLADGVLIDGIGLTGDALLQLDKTADIYGLTVTNLVVTGHSINKTSADSSIAPINLVAGSGFYLYDFSLTNSYFHDYASSRPMIMFIDGVNGLTVEDNVFVGKFNNYNDAIKTNNTRECIKGDVSIKHNRFENYQQYTIWFRGYGAGNYEFIGNEFVKCNDKDYAGNNATFAFITYKGEANEDISIKVYNNTLDNCAQLLRIDAGENITGDTMIAEVKYNILKDNCFGTYYIKNASKMTVICDQNYWGSATPVETKFMGVKEHTNDLADEASVPSEDEAWFLDKLLVGEGKTYATLKDALAAAVDGDEIYVFPGTYEDEVVVDKNVIIYGAQMGIKGALDRGEESIIAGKMTIAADGVIIDGLKFTSNIDLKKAEGTLNLVTLANIVMVANTVIASGSDARKGQLVSNSNVENLMILSSYFEIDDTAASGRDNIVLAGGTTENLIITDNYLGNKVAMASPNFYSEAVKVSKPVGHMILMDNEIRFTTDNFIVFYGSISNSTVLMTIQDNILGAFESTANGTAGVAIRNLPAGSQLDIIHNVFLHHNGNVVDTNYGGEAYVSILYNHFDLNTAFKWSNHGSTISKFEGNYYEAAPVAGHEPSDYGVITSADALEAAYEAYLESLNQISDTVLTFNLNGGLELEELPAVHVYGEETALPALYKEGYEFLGWSTDEEGTKFVKSIGPKVSDAEIVLYAQFKYICVTVGQGGDYATLTDAIANVKEFAVIKLLPGTYDETVEIKTNYLRIEGPNADIPYDDAERGEEAIIGGLKLNGVHDIVINGVKFSNAMGIDMANGVKNISILNSLFGATASVDNTAMINCGGGRVDGLLVKGCSFVTIKGRTHYRAIRLEGTGVYSSNIVVQENFFQNDCAGSVYIDCVKVADLTGFVDISYNHFDWPGNNWTVFIGGGSCSEGVKINFVGNMFYPVEDGSDTMSGATFRNLKADTVVNILGNSFSNVGGTVLQTNGGTAAHVTVKNNALLDTSAKCAWNVAADNFVFENNWSYTAYNNTGTQTPTEIAESADAAIAGMGFYTVEFNTLPGAMFRGSVEVAAVGTSLVVSRFIPTYTGHRFLGWYDNEELNGEVVTSVSEEAVLYAKYEEIPTHTITYVLNGGELTKPQTEILDDCVLVLPTPEKFGSSFLGWSLTEEGTEYVDRMTITEDVTFYAHWLDEEVFDVTVVLNGGSMRYGSREDVVADFLKDYNKVMGTNWQTAADIGTANFDPVSWHTFYGKDLDSKTTVRDKWLWLAKYLYRVSSAQLASNNCNVMGLKVLVDGGSNWGGDNPYGLLYAFRSFLQGNTARPGSSYTSVDFSIYENANGFWPELSEAEPTQYQFTASQTLPAAHLQNYAFGGWYLDAEFTGDPITSITGNCTIYAKFVEEKPVTSVEITNKITELVKFGTHQLTWTINPSDAVINQVTFKSSDETIATVDPNGLVTALKEGNVTITMTSASGAHPTDTMTFEVYSPDHFEVSYETNSYTTVDGELQLNAVFERRDGSKADLEWASEDTNLATVDANGKVTAKATGLVKITVSVAGNGSFTFDFYVTVVSDELSEAMQSVLEGHNGNIFTRYDLGIGAGKPAYYRDIFGDVNDMMFNEKLSIDLKYYSDGTTGTNHGPKKQAVPNGNASGVEWIVIHYTGNMSKGSTAAANANYFANLSADTSINYVIGNDGTFNCLDDDYVAFHAGDGTGVPFEWYEAGIDYVEGDPQYAVPGIVKDNDKYYFTLNGKKSNVEVPDPKLTVTDNAKNSSTSAYYKFEEDYANPKWFNDLGLPVKVMDGKYYIGKTWWCYTQVLEGRICSRGGNLNGIGIESAVNPESDLWYTWDKLAQLAAYLMVKYNLDITRVRMHHFFSAKDCHQPFLANHCEIWWDFLDQVKLEHERITKFSDYTYTMTVADDSKAIVSDLGRVSVPDYATSVLYTVEVKNTATNTTETITLSSAINGVFAK